VCAGPKIEEIKKQKQLIGEKEQLKTLHWRTGTTPILPEAAAPSARGQKNNKEMPAIETVGPDQQTLRQSGGAAQHASQTNPKEKAAGPMTKVTNDARGKEPCRKSEKNSTAGNRTALQKKGFT